MSKVRPSSFLLSLVIFIGLNVTVSVSESSAFSLGCSKAQAEAKKAGFTATVAIQAEERYINRSEFTYAYQEYLAINRFTNEWKKIVSKSPKCFKSQIIKIEPIFNSYYKKATMCERYGAAICKAYPSTLPPRKRLTLADICGRNPSSYSYKECVRRLSEPSLEDIFGYP